MLITQYNKHISESFGKRTVSEVSKLESVESLLVI